MDRCANDTQYHDFSVLYFSSTETRAFPDYIRVEIDGMRIPSDLRRTEAQRSKLCSYIIQAAKTSLC